MSKTFRKVLVVDDDLFARKLITSFAKDLDMEIHEATNGTEALQMVSVIVPDLIFMDVIMPEGEEQVETIRSEDSRFTSIPDYSVMDISVPGGNGIDAARRIKLLYPDIPIVGVSGAESAYQTTLGADDYLRILKMVGADATIVKPVSRKAFFRVISELQKKELTVTQDDFESQLQERLEMQNVRRSRQPSSASDPVPDNLQDFLTKDQLTTVDTMENYGWTLTFVRRANPKNIIVLMTSPSGLNTALIEEDGDLNVEHHVFIRQQTK